jgi:hypothetical protein
VEPRQGRKTLVRNIFLPLLQGFTQLSDPSPGLRPGLFSFGPSGAFFVGRVISRQKPFKLPEKSMAGILCC